MPGLRRIAILAAACFVGTIPSASLWAGGTPVPQTGRNTTNMKTVFLLGSGAQSGYGDWLSSTQGQQDPYRFYIEVPPGTTQLVVQVFDPDTGSTGQTANGDPGNDTSSDFNIGGFADVTCRYRLISPTGVPATTTVTGNLTANGNTAGNAPNPRPVGPSTGVNSGWITLATVANPVAGHWEVDANMTSGFATGDDVNSFGLRAYVTDPGTGDRELNVYYHSFFNFGHSDADSNNTTARSKNYLHYPYITADCDCVLGNFDADRVSDAQPGATYTLTSRSGSFTTGLQNSAATISGNNAWVVATHAGISRRVPYGVPPTSPTNRIADDYGIWTLSFNVGLPAGTANNQNYATIFLGRAGVVAPGTGAANPYPNTYRVYLPSDAGTAPVKPFMRQYVDLPDIPGNGSPGNFPLNQTRTFRVTVDIVNPTPFPISFNAAPNARLVAGNVPNVTGITGFGYQGVQSISQGSMVSQPAIGGTGNWSWNPGTLAAGATAKLRYLVAARATSNGQTIRITGQNTSATEGTRATWLDETGQLNFDFGPLCHVEVTHAAVLFANVTDFTATVQPGQQPLLSWTTSLEIDNVGFNVYRAVSGPNGWEPGEQLNTTGLIPPIGENGGTYTFLDPDQYVERSDEPMRAYFLEDVDLNGATTLHGPAMLQLLSGTPTEATTSWKQYE